MRVIVPNKIIQALRAAAEVAKSDDKDPEINPENDPTVTQSLFFISSMLSEMAQSLKRGEVAHVFTMLEEDLIEDEEFMEYLPKEVKKWILENNEPLSIRDIEILKWHTWKTA